MIICSLCRSTLEPIGHIDFNAPKISTPICPVCQYPNWINSGYPIPHIWDSLRVIKRVEPKVVFRDVVNRLADKGIDFEKNVALKEEDKKSIYEDFNVAKALGTSAEYVSKSISSAVGQVAGGTVKGTLTGLASGFFNGGGAIIFVLIIIYLLTRK